MLSFALYYAVCIVGLCGKRLVTIGCLSVRPSVRLAVPRSTASAAAGGFQARRQEMKWGVFCKKMKRNGCWTYFLLHFTYLGVRTHPTHPSPAYGPGFAAESERGQQISIDSRCCRATRGPRKFWPDTKDVQHSLLVSFSAYNVGTGADSCCKSVQYSVPL